VSGQTIKKLIHRVH